jgi:hypothetical protein
MNNMEGLVILLFIIAIEDNNSSFLKYSTMYAKFTLVQRWNENGLLIIKFLCE